MADRANNRVLIWAEGFYVPTKNISGGLNRPIAIFVDTKGDIYVDEDFNLYVADRDNNRIQRFSFGQHNGTTIVGSTALGTISLKQTTTVVFDADNYLFIVNSNNDRIVGSGPNGYRCLVIVIFLLNYSINTE